MDQAASRLPVPISGQKDTIKLPKLHIIKHNKRSSQGLQSYWTFREETMIEDGIFFKGTQIVMAAQKHESVLKFIHEGHLGLNKCKLHAKETVYWPGLNNQLDRLIPNCELCLKYSHSKCKQ